MRTQNRKCHHLTLFIVCGGRGEDKIKFISIKLTHKLQPISFAHKYTKASIITNNSLDAFVMTWCVDRRVHVIRSESYLSDAPFGSDIVTVSLF